MTNKNIHKTCHKGPVLVLESRGLVIYGASANEADENFYDFNLVISLDWCRPKYPQSNLTSIGFQRLTNSDNFTEHMILKWPDMGVPTLTKEFWIELAYQLRKKGRDKERFYKKYKVMIHCIGGHGRTGTALAILTNLCSDKISNPEFHDSKLLEIIRAKHCEKAVETARQIDYIEYILGLKLDHPKPSKTFNVYLNLLIKDQPTKSFNGYNSSFSNSMIARKAPTRALTQLEKDKKQIEKEVRRIKNKPSKICAKHNAVLCRNCRDEYDREINKEVERLVELARLDREKVLQGRIDKFMDSSKDELIYAQNSYEIRVYNKEATEEQIDQVVREILGD